MPRAGRSSTKRKLPSESDLLHRIVRLAGEARLANVLEEVLVLVDEIASADATLVYLAEREGGAIRSIVLEASHPPHPDIEIRLAPGEGITGWVAANRAPVAIAERAYDDPRFKVFRALPEDRYEAFLSVPILRGAEGQEDLVGVLNVQHRKPFRHPPALVRLMASLARQVAGVIERERLLEEAQRRANALEALAGVSVEVASGREPDAVLDAVVRATAAGLGFKICSIMLLDPERDELRIVATQSLSPAYRSKPAFPVRGSLSGRTVLERRPLMYRDVRRETSYRFPEVARAEGLVSLLSVPMTFGEECVGVINAYTAEEHEFDAEEVAALRTVANQCAAAISHARALRRAIEAREALETRKIVDRAKAVLIKKRGMTEEEAHREIQKRSMDHRRTLREVAEAILLVEGE